MLRHLIFFPSIIYLDIDKKLITSPVPSQCDRNKTLPSNNQTTITYSLKLLILHARLIACQVLPLSSMDWFLL